MNIWLKTVTSSYWKPQIKWVMGSICCDWFAVSCKEIKSLSFMQINHFLLFSQCSQKFLMQNLVIIFDWHFNWLCSDNIGDFWNGRGRLLSTSFEITGTSAVSRCICGSHCLRDLKPCGEEQEGHHNSRCCGLMALQWKVFWK